MQIQPCLFFNVRCEEAVEFYRNTLGALGFVDPGTHHSTKGVGKTQSNR